MKNVSASRLASLAFVAFFAVTGTLLLLSAIGLLRRNGADPYVSVYLARAGISFIAAYGLYRDRRWLLPILGINLALAVERYASGASGFTLAAIAANAAVLGVIAWRRDRWTGPLWAIAPTAIFVAAQLVPYLVERPVLQ